MTRDTTGHDRDTMTRRTSRPARCHRHHDRGPRAWPGPLDDELVSALTALRKRQPQDSEAAGTTFRAGLDGLGWYTSGDDYVVTDELGIPVHPEWYPDEFGRLLKRAKLRKIRLYDSRHTALSLMEKAASRSPSSASGPGTTTPRSP